MRKKERGLVFFLHPWVALFEKLTMSVFEVGILPLRIAEKLVPDPDPVFSVLIEALNQLGVLVLNL